MGTSRTRAQAAQIQHVQGGAAGQYDPMDVPTHAALSTVQGIILTALLQERRLYNHRSDQSTHLAERAKRVLVFPHAFLSLFPLPLLSSSAPGSKAIASSILNDFIWHLMSTKILHKKSTYLHRKSLPEPLPSGSFPGMVDVAYIKESCDAPII